MRTVFRLAGCVCGVVGLVLAGGTASAETFVSGPITSTTWAKANSPYRVTGIITIPIGNTLTIEPGVDVLFDAEVQFVVQGRLQAVGTETDSIRFIKGTAVNWRGFRFISGTSADSSRMEYARISDGRASVSVGDGDDGGAAYLSGSYTRVTLCNVVIAGNVALSEGGGLCNSGGTATLTNCTISDNHVSQNGGGLYNLGGTATLTNCTISGNSAAGGNGGGGLYNEVGGTATLTNCTISGNGGGNDGAGLLNFGTASLANCAITGNTASGHGGGVQNQGGTATLMNCTISGNWAGFSGGGLYNYGLSGTATLRNAIVWGNTPAQQVYVEGGSVAATYSDIQGGYSGTGNIDADPLFVNASGGDYHLQGESPCINTGDPALPLDPNGTRADMGAFPYNQSIVGGTIGTATWTKSNSPYRVTGTITVPSGNTLTIESGVDVLFDADVQFVVNGVLHAVGTPQDSIRFIRGAVAEWGGIRISGGGPDTLAYVRISDAHGDGGYPGYDGGAMFVNAPGVVVELANVVMSGNRADHDAGGLMIYTGTVTMSDCAVRDNTAMFGAGLCLYGASAVVSLSHTVIADNTASGLPGQEGGGGGVFLNVQSSGTFTNCTIAGNTTDIGAGSGIFVTNSATAHFHNSVVWGNNPGGTDVATSGASLDAEYSDLPGGYSGTGNINADPLFVDAGAGDYRLTLGSPCINTADPTSPLDPDGTYTDMGGFWFDLASDPDVLTGRQVMRTLTAGVYQVKNTVTVPSGNTLTIGPGVDVLFDADVQFIVNGVLNAVGTAQDSIRFIKGTAPEWGGIRVSGGDSSTLHYARISNAVANNPSPGERGGGVSVSGVNTRLGLAHTVIAYNRSAGVAGGMNTEDGARITMIATAIRDNVGGWDAGGLMINYTAVSMTDCIISGNTSSGHVAGGVSINTPTPVTMVNCVVSRNTASYDGGGLYLGGAQTRLEAVRTVIERNHSSGVGGGIEAWANAGVTLTNCTVANNTASGGGALDLFDGGSVTAENTIIWGNAAGEISLNGGYFSATYSDIEGGYRGTGNVKVDPLFVDAGEGDYHLQEASPCIDAGNPASPLDPDGTRADMGAFSFDQSVLRGPTYVSGVVTKSLWRTIGTPYRVTDTLTVPSGNTLTIQSGVDVLFDADVQFVVNGVLHAVGTPQDSIRFMKGEAPEWGGIRFAGVGLSAISFARVSHGHAKGTFPDQNSYGGGIALWGNSLQPTLQLDLSNVVLSYNHAEQGGGIAVDTATATLTNCVIRGNIADTRGGGFYANTATYILTGCTIMDNTVPNGLGGGLRLWDGHGTLNNCTISGNMASSNGGGLISSSGAVLTMTNCTIIGNTASWGGGVHSDNATLTMTNCTTSGNIASSGDGGGVYNTSNATLTMTNCTISGNSAYYGGGGVSTNGTATLTMTNCGISANTASSYGGGIENCQATAALTNCTISGNAARNGGGMENYENAVLTLTNCTLSSNTAAGDGGGVHDSSATLTMTNAILWGNSAPNGPEMYRESGAVTVRYTDVQGGIPDGVTDGGGNMNADPLFSTHPDSACHLTGASLCIDAGDPASPLDPDGTRTDMGAYYYRGLYGDVSRDGTIAAYDASLILRSLVGLIAEVLEFYADVTGNGFTSAYDAHLILRKAMDPTFVFPVEGGELPKAAADVLRALTWVRDGAGWALVVNDPTGIVAGEMTLIVPGSSPATVRGGDLIECNQDGSTLHVAFVRMDSGESVLLRLESAEIMQRAPLVTRVRLNEGLISVASVSRPMEFALEQNVPNPFNPQTTVRFSVPEAGQVQLIVYSATGQCVRILVDGTLEAGTHDVVWDGRDAAGREVASGVYLCRLTAEQGVRVRRMVLLK